MEWQEKLLRYPLSYSDRNLIIKIYNILISYERQNEIIFMFNKSVKIEYMNVKYVLWFWLDTFLSYDKHINIYILHRCLYNHFQIISRSYAVRSILYCLFFNINCCFVNMHFNQYSHDVYRYLSSTMPYYQQCNDV